MSLFKDTLDRGPRNNHTHTKKQKIAIAIIPIRLFSRIVPRILIEALIQEPAIFVDSSVSGS